MNRLPVRASDRRRALGLLALFVAACGSSDDAPADAKAMTFKLTDAGCDPHDAKAPAGPINFEVENGGTAKVTELEVLDGETILGETREHHRRPLRQLLADPRGRRIHAPLQRRRRRRRDADRHRQAKTDEQPRGRKGDRRLPRLPRGKHRRADRRRRSRSSPPSSPANIAKAKQLYPAARIPYERIEPVAESFGDLDPRIDARENDVPPSEFGGFHRIEKALWEEDTAEGHGAGRRSSCSTTSKNWKRK